jgi:hypothetical protein
MTSPPPSLVNFRVFAQASGLRQYEFDFGTKALPPDMDGFRIFYFDTDDLTGEPISYDLMDSANFTTIDAEDYVLSDFSGDEPPLETMTELYNGRIRYSPFEYNAPFSGEWIFAIVSVDVGNLQSVPLYTAPITLAAPQLGNSLFYLDFAANNWLEGQTPGAVPPGDWQVSGVTGYLQALVTNDWGTDPSSWATSFTDGWLGISGAGGFTYTLETGVINFDPVLPALTDIRVEYTTEASMGNYVVNYAFNGSGVFVPLPIGGIIDNLDNTTSSVEFQLVGTTIPAEGLRNWIVEGYASAGTV